MNYDEQGSSGGNDVIHHLHRHCREPNTVAPITTSTDYNEEDRDIDGGDGEGNSSDEQYRDYDFYRGRYDEFLRENGDGNSNDAQYCDYGFDEFLQIMLPEEQMVGVTPAANSTFTDSRDITAAPEMDGGEECNETIAFPEILVGDEPIPCVRGLGNINDEVNRAPKEAPAALSSQPAPTPAPAAQIQSNQEQTADVIAVRPTEQSRDQPDEHPPFFEVEARLVEDPEDPTVYDAIPIPIPITDAGVPTTFWERYQPALIVGIVLLVVLLVMVTTLLFAPWEELDHPKPVPTVSPPNQISLSTPAMTTVETTKPSIPTMKFTSDATKSSSGTTVLPSADVTVLPLRIGHTTAVSVKDSTTGTKSLTTMASPATTIPVLESTTRTASSVSIPTTVTAPITAPSTLLITTTAIKKDAATATSSQIKHCDKYEVSQIEQTQHSYFGPDCEEECVNVVAINESGDTVMVAREKADIQFRANVRGRYKVVTTMKLNDKVDTTAISDDIAVAGYTKTSSSGWKSCGVRVYEKESPSSWIETANITPSDLNFGLTTKSAGTVVDVDGSRLIFGVPDNGQPGYRGSAYIYHQKGDSWVQEARLVPTGRDKNVEWFGASVAIKGTTVAIGDFRYGNDDEGAVFIYEYDSSANLWKRSHTILNEGCEQWFGAALTLMYDGRLLVECPAADNYIGAVYYYTKSPDDTEYVMRQKIRPSFGEANDQMGSRVAVDRDIMLAGTLLKESEGEVYAYQRTNIETWKQVATIRGPSNSVNFGTDFDVTYDSENSRRVIVVGSDGNTHYYKLECS